MEASVDQMAAPPPFSSPELSLLFVKGKRTKRLRHDSPLPFITFSPHPLDHDDMEAARCLILLSQGDPQRPDDEIFTYYMSPQKKHMNNANGCTTGGASYVCKTCNRTFSSFQALGGHRTSHRKVKAVLTTAIAAFSDDDDDDDDDFPSPSRSRRRLSPNAMVTPRMHECAYCGADFTSGQALGGHMRKHRVGPRPPNTILVATSIEELQLHESKKLMNVGLSLDLNLPAPADNQTQSFMLQPAPEEAETGLTLSTMAPTPLVDCHN